MNGHKAMEWKNNTPFSIRNSGMGPPTGIIQHSIASRITCPRIIRKQARGSTHGAGSGTNGERVLASKTRGWLKNAGTILQVFPPITPKHHGFCSITCGRLLRGLMTVAAESLDYGYFVHANSAFIHTQIEYFTYLLLLNIPIKF